MDLKSLNVNWLRKNIGVVSQEPVLFDMTIAENIKFGAIHEATQQEIEDAAKMANAHEFISQLPNVIKLNLIISKPHLSHIENCAQLFSCLSSTLSALSTPALIGVIMGTQCNKGRRKGVAFIYGRAVMEN